MGRDIYFTVSGYKSDPQRALCSVACSITDIEWLEMTQGIIDKNKIYEVKLGI